MTTILAATGDEHVNDEKGLCSVRQFTPEGKPKPHNATQEAALRAFGKFADKVEQTAEREHAEHIVWVNVGDAADLNCKGLKTQIAHTEAEVKEHMAVVFRRLTNLSHERYIVKGTEFHNGEECGIEAAFGADIGAMVDPDTGEHAWWHLKLECEGVLFDIAHHPKFRSKSEWGLVGAAERESAHVALTYARSGERIPDVVLRAHQHAYADSGDRARPKVFFLDGWQAMTSYGYNKGFTVASAIGGEIFVCSEGRFTAEREWYRPRKERVWKTCSK
jgi:hypothetical protein